MRMSSIILLCAFTVSACNSRPATEGSRDRPLAVNASKGLLEQAKLAGITFRFEADKKEYAVGSPIMIVVYAENTSERKVALRPRSIYPSLFDFGVFDNGKHVPYTMNMALNTIGKTVTIPARSRIVWIRENVVESTKAGDGSSPISVRGRHRLSFWTGNAVDIIVK